MYNIKGPSKIVAKTTRRGISQNIETLRDCSKGTKSLDSNDNEITTNGPKPVFHRRNLSNGTRQQDMLTPQHEEIIKYIHDAWLSVSSDIENGNTQSDSSNSGNCSVLYYEDDPCPELQDFKPFDLESWWGRRLYNIITSSVNEKN